MKNIEINSSLGNTEVIALYEKASKLLESSEGHQILRELEAFDWLAHNPKGTVGVRPGKKRVYTTDDYIKHPDWFSITDFYPAVYFVEDSILLTADNPYTHRARLEEPIAAERPELHARLQKGEVRAVAGDTFRVRNTDIQFFAVKGDPNLQLKGIRGTVASQLAKHGLQLLFWYWDEEWRSEQLKRPEFARYVAYEKRMKEAKSRGQLFTEWGDILLEFGGHSPDGPGGRMKGTIISPLSNETQETLLE